MIMNPKDGEREAAVLVPEVLDGLGLSFSCIFLTWFFFSPLREGKERNDNTSDEANQPLLDFEGTVISRIHEQSWMDCLIWMINDMVWREREERRKDREKDRERKSHCYKCGRARKGRQARRFKATRSTIQESSTRAII